MGKTLIDSGGALSLLIMLICAKLVTPVPRMLALESGSSVWLMVLLSGLLAMVVYWGLAALLNRFPGHSLAMINMQVHGAYFGPVFNLIEAVYFVGLGGLMLRAFTAGFRIAVMPQTPPAVLISFLLATALFAAYRGLETLGRMAAFLAPVLGVLALMTLLGPVRVLNLTNLFPFFGNGVTITLLSPLWRISLFSEILVLGCLSRFIQPGQAARIGWKAMAWATGIQTLVLLILCAAFPFPAVSRIFFAVLDLTRMIEISEFIQRVEALFVFLWFFLAALKLALLLMAAADVIQETAGLADHRPLLPALALLFYAIGFLPISTVDLAHLDDLLLRTWSWPVALLPPWVTLAVAAWRQVRGESSHAG